MLPPLPRGKMRRLCWRLPPVEGKGRWIIAGPVVDHQDMDPKLFTKAVVVEGLQHLSSREIYVRSLPMLIKKGLYPSWAAAHESLLHVFTEHDVSRSSSEEPTRDFDSTNGLPLRLIRYKAAAAVTRSRGRVSGGFVEFISFEPTSSHPWCAYETRLLWKRNERKGAVSYRRRLSHLTDDDERRLLRAANSSALSSVRKATTYSMRTAAEKARGLRPLKKRPWGGVAAPDLIPARKRLIAMKRRVFERCDRVGHSMVTLDQNGDAVAWSYVRGSGLTGVRHYEAADGTVMRLACHSHKQRKKVPVAAPSNWASGAAASSADYGFLAGDEDERPDPTDRPLNRAELSVMRNSTFENSDGSGVETIDAVAFDIVAAVRASIALRTKRCTAENVLNGSAAAWSLGADGGPVMRSAITLFTLTLSADWLVAGRTAMVAVLYFLAGEHRMHSSLGATLDQLVSQAVRAMYEVRVHTTNSDHGSDAEES